LRTEVKDNGQENAGIEQLRFKRNEKRGRRRTAHKEDLHNLKISP
jgi:hypothetical protein